MFLLLCVARRAALHIKPLAAPLTAPLTAHTHTLASCGGLRRCGRLRGLLRQTPDVADRVSLLWAVLRVPGRASSRGATRCAHWTPSRYERAARGARGALASIRHFHPASSGVRWYVNSFKEGRTSDTRDRSTNQNPPTGAARGLGMGNRPHVHVHVHVHVTDRPRSPPRTAVRGRGRPRARRILIGTRGLSRLRTDGPRDRPQLRLRAEVEPDAARPTSLPSLTSREGDARTAKERCRWGPLTPAAHATTKQQPGPK